MKAEEGVFQKIEGGGIAVPLDAGYLKELGCDIGNNINDIAYAGAFVKTSIKQMQKQTKEQKILYFCPKRLPPAKYIVCSATLNETVYRRYFEGTMPVYSYPYIKAAYRGEVVQHIYHSLGRRDLKGKKQVFFYAKKAAGNEDVKIRRLGYVDRNFLEEACQNALILREEYEDDMECLCAGVFLLEKDGDKRLKAKFHNIFGRVKFHQKWDLWRPGKVTVLDLSGYPHAAQTLLTQLVLSVLWRYHQVYGQQMNAETTVALDEFQNLPLKNNSILEQILREGRKFHLSLLLATQTLYTFDTAQRAVLQQPGTKLYFKPVESELKKIAKQFPDIAPADAEKLLQNLGVGECLACGTFNIGGISSLRTLKVNFWER